MSGSNLTANLVIAAPTNFQVSTTGDSGFGSSVTLTPSGGTVATTTIYVRFAPTSSGAKSGNVTNASTGATTQNIAVSGTGIPGVSVGDVTLPEPPAPASGTTSSYAQFPVTLSEVLAQSVTVSFSTADGTAVAPGDYTALSGTVTFAPGETQKTLAVAVKSDSVSESSETFSLSLSNPVGAAVGDGTGVATITQPVAAGTVIISEFRLSGPDGANDEYVEIYNNTDADITVTDASPTGCAAQVVTLGLTPQMACGWALVDLQGAVSNIPRFVVPFNTVIPARGHYLAVGSAYSLSALTAADLTYGPPGYGDADYTGLVLYKTADRDQFTPANIFDSVGFQGVALPFREGNGLPLDGVDSGALAQHAFVRNQGSGRPADTGDNRADFTLVATDPTLITNGVATLGAPGPENRTGTVTRTSGFTVGIPPGVSSSARNLTGVTNGPLGTYSLRRRYKNNTGQTLTKLRFRVTDVQTLNGRVIYNNQADLRVIDAMLVGLGGSGLKALTVETPPSQPSGGGVNTGLVVSGSLALAQPLQNGQTVDVEFLLGVVRDGKYQFIITIEAAP